MLRVIRAEAAVGVQRGIPCVYGVSNDKGQRCQQEERGGNGTSGCNCECAGLLEAIQQAVQQAAAGVSLTATVTQALMTTDYGTISVTGDATAAGGTGSSSVSFSY